MLKDRGLKIGAARFFKVLESAGIVVRHKRATTQKKRFPGGIKEFWALTEAGTAFGKNVTDPRAQREVAPHFSATASTNCAPLPGRTTRTFTKVACFSQVDLETFGIKQTDFSETARDFFERANINHELHGDLAHKQRAGGAGLGAAPSHQLVPTTLSTLANGSQRA